MEQNKLLNLILDNMKKIFFPEDWLEIDMKLSKTELFTLLIIERHGEAIMSQIANKINVSMSTATGIIDRLVKKKYLSRARSESDRRIVLIRLTKKGKQIVNDIKDSINYYLNTIFKSLNEEEVRVLSNIIVKIINALSEEKLVENKETREKSSLKKIEIE